MTTQQPARGTWSGADTATWLAMADQRERALAPVLTALMTAAALQPGERVLDVGCGTGPTTAAAATAVTPGGAVTAIDVAPELIAEARRRVPDPAVSWLVGDAERYPLPDFSYDVVLSRFGVMFFGDPYAAFTTFWRATRMGGRLAFTVWPPRDENAYFAVPLAAVCRALDRLGEPYDPLPVTTGPSAFGDPDFLVELLRRTGWIAADLDTIDTELTLAEPGSPAEQVAAGLLRGGAPRELVAGRSEAVRRAALEELTAEMASRMTTSGLSLPARFRVVTARR